MADQNNVVDAIIARVFAEAMTQCRIAGERIGLERKANEMRLEAAARDVVKIEAELKRVQGIADQMVEAGQAQSSALDAISKQRDRLVSTIADVVSQLDAKETPSPMELSEILEEVMANPIDDTPDLDDLASTIARRED